MSEYEIVSNSSVIATDARIQAFWDAQSEWSQATFGLDTERDHVGALKHLAKEAVEAQVRPADHIELADCLFLTFDAARRAGLTLAKLIETAEQKLVINKARKWNKPTSDEPVEHVRDEEVKIRSCNRHSNCETADALAKTKGAFAASHCHDDSCEDCFGC